MLPTPNENRLTFPNRPHPGMHTRPISLLRAFPLLLPKVPRHTLAVCAPLPQQIGQTQL